MNLDRNSKNSNSTLDLFTKIMMPEKKKQQEIILLIFEKFMMDRLQG